MKETVIRQIWDQGRLVSEIHEERVVTIRGESKCAKVDGQWLCLDDRNAYITRLDTPEWRAYKKWAQ